MVAADVSCNMQTVGFGYRKRRKHGNVRAPDGSPGGEDSDLANAGRGRAAAGTCPGPSRTGQSFDQERGDKAARPQNQHGWLDGGMAG